MNLGNFLIISFIAFSLSGCATVYSPPPIQPRATGTGIYHKVERGQTLWNISRVYNVDLENILKINNIPDSGKIEVGQLILIPARNTTFTKNYDISQNFIWPLEGKVITDFGGIYNDMANKGINIRPASSANVVASGNGKVVFCSKNFGNYGKTLIIEHQDGFQTVYTGDSEIIAGVGDYVEKGAAIAKITSNGGNFLHFEIRKKGIAQNPYFYLP